MSAPGGQRIGPPARTSVAVRPDGGAALPNPSADAASVPGSSLLFERDGAQRHVDAARPLLRALDSIAAFQPQHRAGTRLHGIARLDDALSASPVHAIAARHVGPLARPVRAILFDKSPAANWSLGWQQDRAIAVRKRHETAGLGPWTVKQGILHVAPPFGIIERMMTLRIHLDDVPADNAPLLIAPGSHRLGLVAEPDVDAAVARCGTYACLARRGDIWVYATPMLHASHAATGNHRRRVLQVDYAADELPGGLAWLGL